MDRRFDETDDRPGWRFGDDDWERPADRDGFSPVPRMLAGAAWLGLLLVMGFGLFFYLRTQAVRAARAEDEMRPAYEQQARLQAVQ